MRERSKQVGEKKSSRAARGFSLIELLIVVAVILIIAAIAIPNFIRSKMRANEAAAVAGVRNITTAEVVYNTTYNIGYSPTLMSLGGTGVTADPTAAGLIDSVLAAGTKSGYSFSYSALTTDASGDVQTFSINADPVIPGQTGDNHYYSDQTDIIRVNGTTTASATDPAIQ